MDQSISKMEARDIDRAIGEGVRWLRFNPELERRFEADNSDARCRHMIRQNYIGLVIYHFFLLSDYRSVGDVFTLDMLMHFGVMTPYVLILNAVLARRPSAAMREGLTTLGVFILCLSVVIVTTSSRYPDRDVIHGSLALVVLFATITQRLRFHYVAMICVSCQALFGIGLGAMGVSTDRFITANSVFLGVVSFSLVAAYQLEHERRMSYLLRLRDQCRNRDLEQDSLRDALTGIGNRRALDAALRRLSGTSPVGSPSSVAVLLLDIDHFKLFNDTNGHQEGDACLAQVARLVAGSLRGGEGDAYRFGGEEFLVLLNDATVAHALGVAERIRSHVERAGIPRDRAAAAIVTVSVGVAAGRLGHESTSLSLIADADRALYAAKREGRNRVVAAPDGGGAPLVNVSDMRMAG